MATPTENFTLEEGKKEAADSEGEADFSTGFELDPHSNATLHISNSNLVNREKITQQTISSTRFSARLSSVTYGTLPSSSPTPVPEPACLVVIDFAFSFRAGTRARFTRADIAVIFGQAADPAFSPLPPPKDGASPALDDPVVRLFAPVQLWGVATVQHESRLWRVGMPVTAQAPGGVVQGGVEVSRESGKEVDIGKRMNVRGELIGDDAHVDGDNGVEWVVGENAAQKDGIPHRLTVAIVVSLPKSKSGMTVAVEVKPAVAFSMNPLRLMQQKHDPIYLDGKTGKGTPPVGVTDFADPSIDWAKVIKFEAEYQDRLI
jgi:hypothetical protein